MRLLQLTAGEGKMLDLHPNVSVVTGLGQAERAVLVDAVVRLARGEAATGPGLLEAHGIMFDLEPALVGVLEPTSKELDPIVQSGQLPSHATSSETRALRVNELRLAELSESIADLVERRVTMHQAHEAASAAVESLRAQRDEAALRTQTRQERLDEWTRRRALLSERQHSIEAELAEIGPSLASAQSARTEVEGRTAVVRAAVDEATALRVSVDEELGQLDPISQDDARAEADAARARLQAVESDVEAERAEDVARERARAETDAGAEVTSDPEREPASVRLERLDRRLQELDQLLVVVTPVRQAAVETARGQLAGGEAVPLVKSPEANLLADDLDRLAGQLAEFGQGADESSSEVSPAEGRARLDEARQALLEAEQAMRSHDVDAGLVASLEAVHEELVDSLERSDARFSPGAKRAAAQVDELRAREEELLDQLGFASYSTYLMGYSIASTDPQLTAGLHAARKELAAAEDAWRVLERVTERALAHAELLDERRRMLDAARQLLGHAVPDGRPQAALRNLTVPAVSAQESARALRDVLDVVGLDLGDEDLDHDELLLIADTWLDQVDQVDDRRRVAMDEMSALQLERIEVAAEAEAELAKAAAGEVAVDNAEPPEEPDREVGRLQRVAEASAALAAAEARLAAAAAASDLRAVLLVDLSAAQEIERGAIDEAGEAEREVAAAVAAEDPLVARVAELDEELVRSGEQLLEVEEALGHLGDPAPDPQALEAEQTAAEALYRDSGSALEEVQVSMAAAEAEREGLIVENERLRGLVTAEATSDATPTKELEWYLLARLAAQRSVSAAGSAPLLLDDTLRGFDVEDLDFLLTRLERMAEAVQVIIVSDDPLVSSWASKVGPERAAVVSLQPC